MRLCSFILLLLLPTTLNADPGLTLVGRLYAPGTSTSGVPGRSLPMVGEFGVEYASQGKLALVGSVDTKLHRYAQGWTIGSVYYHAGVRYRVHPQLLLELKHGSWHNVDSWGPTEAYNRLGVEVKLP